MCRVSAYPDPPHFPVVSEPAFDIAVIRIDRQHALASLLSFEEVAEQFAGLELSGQAAIFGLI